jgi:hypothetical protein
MIAARSPPASEPRKAVQPPEIGQIDMARRTPSSPIQLTANFQKDGKIFNIF